MRRWARSVAIGGLVVTFLGSGTGMIPVALLLLDPMTRWPVGDLETPFPVVVVAGDHASVRMVRDANGFADAGDGPTYLVPAGREKAMERQLRASDPMGNRKASWVLRVRRLSTSRQRIELYRHGDGFWGGVYEASATQATPLYRKLAGPGFAFLFGPLALGLNLLLWGVLWLIRRWYVRRIQEGAAQVATPGAQ